MSKVDAIQKMLINKRNELQSRISKIKKDYSAPLDQDAQEQAIELENAEVLGIIDREAQKELEQINKALNLIESGEYGTCISCGKNIPEKRLEAIPYTNYCLNCADKH